MTPSDTLDALLTASSSPITYRQLSSRLQVPIREAQAYLQAYFRSHPSLQALWCITTLTSTNIRRVSLTTNPPSETLSQTLWALAREDVTPMWLEGDKERMRKMTTDDFAHVNELRDGRFNAITHKGGAWRPGFGTQHEKVKKKESIATGGGGGGGLLKEVRERIKAREKRTKGGVWTGKRTTSSGGGNGTMFKKGSLGESAARKIKQAEKEKENARTKKTRRIVEEESEEESEGEKERQELEREEREREEREREKEELRRELEDLNDKGEEVENQRETNEEKEEGPESPQLQEVEYTKKRSPEKRKLHDAMGLPSVNAPKRIRREVEETVMGSDGYLHTRRVTKVYDEEGNEIVEQEGDNSDKEGRKGNPKDNGPEKTTKENAAMLKPNNGKKKKEVKRPASKTTKKKKKGSGNGNIMSFFSKKP